LDVDVNALRAAYDADYLRRREAKKERDSLQIRRDAFAVPDGLPKEKVNEAALVEELREASTYNEGINRQQRQRDEDRGHRDVLQRDINDNLAKVQELQARIKALNIKLQKADEEMAAWEPLPALKDAEQLAAQITEARTINQGIARRQQRELFDKDITALDEEVEKLTAAMTEREAIRAKAISEAEFPIPGLAFGDNEVIYEGFSFNQASNAAQIRASVAIGMASNPELRVMLIKDGSLLDAKSMNVIAEMALEHDFQVFMEVVDTSGKVGIYIEDGEVARVNPEPEPKPTKAKRKTKQIPATA
jgi:phage FluMu protein gp41